MSYPPQGIGGIGGKGGTPAVVLEATAAAGVATTFLRTDDQLIAFDVTVPVTQASADAAATGSAAVAARRDHKHGMPTISTPGLTRAGGNTTEATTTSTSAVNLIAATVTAITAATPFSFFLNMRKTTGAAASADIGLTLNATLLGNQFLGLGSANEAVSAVVEGVFGARVTGYVRAGLMRTVRVDTTTAQGTPAADIPTSDITTVQIRGIVGSASITLGTDELQVFVYAVS